MIPYLVGYRNLYHWIRRLIWLQLDGVKRHEGETSYHKESNESGRGRLSKFKGLMIFFHMTFIHNV